MKVKELVESLENYVKINPNGHVTFNTLDNTVELVAIRVDAEGNVILCGNDVLTENYAPITIPNLLTIMDMFEDESNVLCETTDKLIQPTDAVPFDTDLFLGVSLGVENN